MCRRLTDGKWKNILIPVFFDLKTFLILVFDDYSDYKFIITDPSLLLDKKRALYC